LRIPECIASLDAFRVFHTPSRYTYLVTLSASAKSEDRRATILAIDYGRSRIGLAIADAEVRLPQPIGTLVRVNRNEDMRRLRELVRDHHVKQIVVGLPLRLDGTQSDMAEEASRFAERIRKQIGVPVEMVDERLTSWEAERLMEEVGGRVIHKESPVTGRKIKKEEGKLTVDSVAAAVILKEYLEKHQPALGSI
jgi:putative Holliday junction resolvase